MEDSCIATTILIPQESIRLVIAEAEIELVLRPTRLIQTEQIDRSGCKRRTNEGDLGEQSVPM